MTPREWEHTIASIILIGFCLIGAKTVLTWLALPGFLAWLMAAIITGGIMWYIYKEAKE